MNPQFGLRALVVAASTCSVGCGATIKTLSLQPGVTNIAKQAGGVDTVNTCTPPSPPTPDPVARWQTEPPQNLGLSTVGFEIWRNTTDGCLEHKEIAYRGIANYDLAAVVPIQATLTKAKLSFYSHVLPNGATPDASNLCDRFAGGLGGLWEVSASAHVPLTSSLVVLAPGAPFPSGVKLMNNRIPWTAGPIGNNGTTDGSPGRAGFTVEVTTSIQRALQAGSSSVQFMLSGSDEAFPRATPPPGSLDCRSLYQFQSLDIEYLGN